VTTGLLTVIVHYIQALPVVYRTLFTVPNLVLINVMACRVFRNIKLGDFVNASDEIQLSSLRADRREDRRRTSDIFAIPFPSGQHPSTGEDSPKMTVIISVERTMEQHQDGSEGKDDKKEHR